MITPALLEKPKSVPLKKRGALLIRISGAVAEQ